MLRPIGKILFIGLAAVVALGAFVAWVNWSIVRAARSRLHATVANVPVNDVALVLGTSPTIRGRRSNPFFEGRMDAAASLLKAGKVRHLLVSGDNGRTEYDEPTAMRDALIARGVPAEAITLDYAGFRTLDSIARAGNVFGLQRCTIVTDDFHQPRSLFLAREHGLDADGFVSRAVPWKWSKKTRLREIASRVKAWLDVRVLRKQPKFFGPRIELPSSARN